MGFPKPLRKALTISVVLATVTVTAGCASEGFDNESATRIRLADPVITPRHTGNGTVYDVELEIEHVTWSSPEIPYYKLEISVAAQNGSLIVGRTPIAPDPGVYNGSVGVWYRDTTGIWDKGGLGDSLLITGMDEERFAGGRVVVHYKSIVAETVTLPTDFP